MLCNDFDVCYPVQGLHHIEPLSFQDPQATDCQSLSKKEDEDHSEAGMSIKDCYYMKAEYSKLPSAQKYGLKLMREKCGHIPGCQGKKYGSENSKNNQIHLDKQSIKAIATQLANSGNKRVHFDDDDTKEDSGLIMRNP